MSNKRLAHKQAIQLRKRRERAGRIQSILGAAKAVFFSKGYIKTSMDDIALEAQVSKPTLYQHFKTKDHLFFSLMIPVVKDTGRRLEEVEKRLADGGYASGRKLIEDGYRGFRNSYEMDPDAFRINQLFQHSGLVWELDPAIRQQLQEIGKYNYTVGRRLIQKAMSSGLLKKRNVYQTVDMLWGGFLGIIQIRDIKSHNKAAGEHFLGTLELLVNTMADALVADQNEDPHSSSILSGGVQ
jgi:TetR/AcrR family transcriptional regulator